MLLEILSSAVFGGVALYAHLQKSGATNDSEKLNKIFSLTGLNVRDKDKTYTAQLVKKVNHGWGTEYRYRIPLGRSFEDYHAKLPHIQDGLNNRSTTLQISLADLKTLNRMQPLFPQIKDLLTKKKAAKKEVEMSFDGLLKLKVYNTPMPTLVSYEATPLSDGWSVPVGQIREGNAIIQHDFEQIPHMVVGGATRYGKSNYLNMLIATLLSQQPEHVRFTLIDLKGGVEFAGYRHIKQVAHYAEEPEEAEEALLNVVEEMRAKQQAFKQRGVKNVQEAKDPIRHFVIVDEVGELNPDEAVTKEERQLKERCQTYMSQIARLGAGLGYRQILATQYPTGDVIPRQCKQNSDAKLCFRVQTATASRVVLDETGAETLPEIRGRAIYQTADKRQIVQTPLIDTQTIRHVVQPHIVIKPRKEQNDAGNNQQSGTTGANPPESGQIRFFE
ncbi:FtsK/SpoIIIE domain-containing protein [Brevibacillus sp. HD3.3A]|uniref:FtsK/SpoIIIE domain-containing protein n=1 Tax=Brevibacillus sp. HD3.3A TaxID=2738979 RepID=UPI00156A8097|nr:FtsK/SpoIIIE domain-containing protein [Brevibacillus sp. HD3.3A]UED70720.1 cell division protein FtsK [Brevibacillus sp. HD3.3A]